MPLYQISSCEQLCTWVLYAPVLMCVVATLFGSWVSTFQRRRLPPPSGPQTRQHERHNIKANVTAFSHLGCSHFYSFLYAGCLLVEKVRLAAFAVLSSVWYRTVETMQGTQNKCSFNLVNRKSFLTHSDFRYVNRCKRSTSANTRTRNGGTSWGCATYHRISLTCMRRIELHFTITMIR